MLNRLIEIEITQPGRPTGQYEVVTNDQFKLEGIHYPDVRLPFDLAIVPRTVTIDGEYLRVLLLGCISHPPRTLVPARLLGGIEGDRIGFFILAAPVADGSTEALNSISDLPETTRKEVLDYLKLASQRAEDFEWKGVDETERIVKQASLQYRQVKAELRKQNSSTPAWQPADQDGRVIGYTEAEHYTEAEYTFFQLPYHFQYYVRAHLADDERILYALRRPAMRSRRQRSWIGGPKLQEGVLILTNQRLLHLVELTPPGSSGVRYGFNAQLGPVERLVGASIEFFNQDAVILKTQWLAKQNIQTLEWEFPISARTALAELCSFLQKFVGDSIKGIAIRQATPPTVPESLPRLTDPAANNPEELDPINERFTAQLSDLIEPTETIYTWALWPAWFEKKGYTQVLLVTNRRILIISDISLKSNPIKEVQMADIASLEYVGSILNSYMIIFVANKDGIQEFRLSFPYSADGAFHTCFEAIRRCMAIIPLS